MRTRIARWPMIVALMAGLLTVPAVLMAQAATEEATPTTKPAGDPAALLRAIPADATAFVAVRNLKEVDNDIVGIAGQIGFQLGPDGMFPAPLEWLKSSLQITSGLNDDGGVALVVLNCQDVKTLDELPNRLVMYIPATNPKELLKSLNAEETTGGVYKFDLAGSPSVAIIKDDYVVATKAPDKAEAGTPAILAEVAKAQGEGVIKTMSPDRVQAFAKQDLFVWLNLRTISVDFRKQMMDSLAEVMRGATGCRMAVGSGMAVGSQPSLTESGQSINPAIENLNQLIDQGEEISVGLLLNAKVGLLGSFYFRAKPDTDLAKALAVQRPAKGSLLVGLPNESAVVAMGASIGTTPELIGQIRKNLETLAAKAAEWDQDKGSPLNAEGLKPLIDSCISLTSGARRVAVSVSDLTAAAGDQPAAKHAEPKSAEPAAAESAAKPTESAAKPAESAVGLAIVVETKDGKAFKAELKKAFDEVKRIAAGVAKADGVEQAKLDNTMSAFVWQENAGRVGEVPFDAMRVDLSKLPDATPEMLAKVKSVLGPDGLMLRVATVGENHIVVAMGGGEKRLAEIAALVEKNQAPLVKSKNIAKIAGRLPAGPRVVEGYIDFAHLLDLVKTVANRLDMPLPINVTLNNAAPLAVVKIAVDKNAQEADVLVPIELIRSGYTAVTQAIMGAAMGGGPGGGSGGSPATIESDGKKSESDGDSDGDEGSSPKPKKARRARPPQPME